MTVSIRAAYVYPVKSMGGIAVSASEVECRGLRHDRRWMLVDAEGNFMTQRTDTRLALFRVAMADTGLVITSPHGERHLVPFEPDGEPRSVRVWKDTCSAVQVSSELDEWFSETLAQACSLVYMPDDSRRPTNPAYTRDGDLVGFADAFPILVVSQTALDTLNARLDVPLPINRFRPNIVLDGLAAHEEDRLQELRIGNLVLRAAKACARCSVTATDQETGAVGKEPLKALADYRMIDQKVYFGAYFVPEQPGFFRVGDVVQVIPKTE